MKSIVYADNNATTNLSKKVLKSMEPYLKRMYGNPSSLYNLGKISKNAIEQSRNKVSKAINSNIDDIYFTSGGSESNNMIIKGISKANRNKGNHIITTKIEHLSVLNTCKELEKDGFLVTYLNVDEYGVINLKELEDSITSKTILISIMFANNEIGAIQPIEEIGKIAKGKDIIFHTDAVQAVGNINIDVEKMNIDALSLSAHKFHGPKGIGVAYIKDHVKFEPLICGGHQEDNKRAGTENVANIVGLGKAIELSNNNILKHNKKINKLNNFFYKLLNTNLSNFIINGNIENKLCNNISISFKNIDSNVLLLFLNKYNICVSNGSACNSNDIKPSHVLEAIKVDKDYIGGTIRISFGDNNDFLDVLYIVKMIKRTIKVINSKKKE